MPRPSFKKTEAIARDYFKTIRKVGDKIEEVQEDE